MSFFALRFFSRGVLVSLAAMVLVGVPAHATPSFPEAIRTHLGTSRAPTCALCHAGTPSFETAVTPFADAMKDRGLEAYDAVSLRSALDQMREDRVDSDQDGAPDVDEIFSGTDPNGGSEVEEPFFGCGGGQLIALLPLSLLGPYVLRRRGRRGRRRNSDSVLFSFFALLLLFGGAANAESPRIVLDVQGKNMVLLRKTLRDALAKSGVVVVFPSAGKLPTRLSGRIAQRVTEAAEANALLMARVTRGTPRRVNVLVFSAPRWDEPTQVAWDAAATRGLRRVPPTGLQDLLDVLAAPRTVEAVKVAQPDAAPTQVPEPVAAPVPNADVAAAEQPAVASAPPGGTADVLRSTTTPALEVVVGARGFSRRLALTQAAPQTFGRYVLPFGPTVIVETAWYPAAHFLSGVWANVGIVANFESGLALRSELGQDVFPTRVYGLELGARGRLPLGPVTLAASVAYLSRGFGFLPSLGVRAQAPLPSVDYQGPRFALDARAQLSSRFGLRLAGGYQWVTSSGQISSEGYFPGMSGGAVDASLAVSWTLISDWSLRGGIDFTRYFLTTNAPPEAVPFAEGALDQSLGVSLALVFTFT
ncbi:MAG: hypothetical protein ACKVPX_11300 [Myxococcaceae bacterium]